MFFPNDIFSYDIFSQDNFSYWHFFLKTFFPKTFFPIKHFFLVTFFPCDIFSQVLFFPKWHFFLILRYFFLLIFPKIFIRKSSARRTEFDFANDLSQLIFQIVLKDLPQKCCWDDSALTLLACHNGLDGPVQFAPWFCACLVERHSCSRMGKNLQLLAQ